MTSALKIQEELPAFKTIMELTWRIRVTPCAFRPRLAEEENDIKEYPDLSDDDADCALCVQ